MKATNNFFTISKADFDLLNSNFLWFKLSADKIYDNHKIEENKVTVYFKSKKALLKGKFDTLNILYSLKNNFYISSIH